MTSPPDQSIHIVKTVEEALHMLDLPSDRQVIDLNEREMAAFRQLIGWEPGGPVISYPTEEEHAARTARESWKAERAGTGGDDGSIWLNTDQIACFKTNRNSDPATTRWWDIFIENAESAAALPLQTFANLIPEDGFWVFAGSFCPNCVGEKSPITQHAGFWRWSVLDPDTIACPYCGITYPDDAYPENGHLDLPRLGLTFPFHITENEQQSDDWRDGRYASNFAGIPTHVSFTGEIRNCKLSWALGQVEPLAVAYAITEDHRYADIVRTILTRMADVYPRYPVFSYGQEYIDTDPAYAALHVEVLPTPFRRAASLGTYTGVYGGGQKNRGLDRTTPATSYYPNGEWGSSRLGREKASNGQLFLSLFKGYDLIRQTLSPEERKHIEQNFLLELYLDVRDFSRYVNNKSGPGAVSRVAVGIFYNDTEALEEGLAQFHEIMEGQFYADGSWKETPIYGAKSLFEGMAEIPELLRGRMDLYADPLYRAAFKTYAETATPLDTYPPLDDSPIESRLQPMLVDIARIRMGLHMSYGPDSLAGFRVHAPAGLGNNSGYVPSLDCIATGQDRHQLDGPIGFGSVGHVSRHSIAPSWISMFNEPRPTATPPYRSALNRYYEGRGLICMGFGKGNHATQLYCDGGDGRRGHRHQAPLSLLLFAGGREVLPDLGYIADHPANVWIKTTASHNTVVVDENPGSASVDAHLAGFIDDGPFRFFDVSTRLSTDGQNTEPVRLRRAVTLFPKPDGLPVLIDIFDVIGGRIHDYIVRANDPDSDLHLEDYTFSDRQPLYEGISAAGHVSFRTAGPCETPLTACWGQTEKLWAHVLTPCDEAATFKAPAWRNREEVFAASDRSWDALVLRQYADRSRFVIVYEVGGETPWIEQVEPMSLFPHVELAIHSKAARSRWVIDEGSCTSY